MILDSEGQKAMLLQIVDAITIAGKDIDAVYSLKQALLKAEIKQE